MNIEKSIRAVIKSLEDYIDYLVKDRNKLSEHNKELKKENENLRRLLVAKFKKAGKDIEITELNIRV